MAVQLSVDVSNARLDVIETTIGASPVLKIFAGAKPANCAASDPATVLATLNLPADWMLAASGGTKSLSGTWEDPAADAAGTAQSWRLYLSDGVTCKMQGTVSATGGGGDITVDNVVFAAGQDFKITGFTLNDNSN